MNSSPASEVSGTAVIRIGTRSSALARWQAEWVAARLTEAGHRVELVWITTSGDARQEGPIGAIGGSGVFTKEIQRALLDNRVDLAVHSLKDLPTEVIPELSLAAVPLRETNADALISRAGCRFVDLPAEARVGTGSARRRTQLRHARSDLQYHDIRGNVDTRLKKLDAGEYDAVVLAAAGLRRLGFESRITEILSPELVISAVGQGALGLEIRTADEQTRAALQCLDHAISHAAVLAERMMLRTLRGGCLAPVGGRSSYADGNLKLIGTVLSPDGATRLLVEERIVIDLPVGGSLNEEQQAAANELGERVANELIQSGAERLIAAAREE